MARSLKYVSRRLHEHGQVGVAPDGTGSSEFETQRSRAFQYIQAGLQDGLRV